MVKIIMHGCNGKMGQVISGLIAADPDMELVAESMPETMDTIPTLYSQIFTNVMWLQMQSLISPQPWQ